MRSIMSDKSHFRSSGQQHQFKPCRSNCCVFFEVLSHNRDSFCLFSVRQRSRHNNDILLSLRTYYICDLRSSANRHWNVPFTNSRLNLTVSKRLTRAHGSESRTCREGRRKLRFFRHERLELSRSINWYYEWKQHWIDYQKTTRLWWVNNMVTFETAKQDEWFIKA